MGRWYHNPDTGHWDLSEEEWLSRQPQIKDPGITVIYGKSFGLPPGEQIKRANNARRNLERDPLHTDLDDYKPRVEAFRDKMNNLIK